MTVQIIPGIEFLKVFFPKRPVSKVIFICTVGLLCDAYLRFNTRFYSETYDATLEAADKTFKVDLPEKNALNLTGCEGAYRYTDGILTLDVTTTFASGRKFIADTGSETA